MMTQNVTTLLWCGGTYVATWYLSHKIPRLMKLHNRKSIEIARKWYKDNRFNIDPRQRDNLDLYLNHLEVRGNGNTWLKKVKMKKDDRGMLMKFYYYRGTTTPTFVIVNDATVKTRIHALMVAPSIKSATAGLAWTIDLTAKEYKRVNIES